MAGQERGMRRMELDLGSHDLLGNTVSGWFHELQTHRGSFFWEQTTMSPSFWTALSQIGFTGLPGSL